MPYRDASDQDEGDILTGTRVCKKCGERKPMSSFMWATGRTCRRRTCLACNSARRRELKAADPAKYHAMYKRRHLRSYGLTKGEHDAMLAGQEGRCAICGDEFAGAHHIDHDHSCCPGDTSCGDCVRGLLCFTCNTAIGKLKDSIPVLQSAIRYLERSRTNADIARCAERTAA